MPKKKLKGGTLWDFSTSILSQNINKMQGVPFGKKFSEKMSQCRIKIERGGMLRGNAGKTFLVQFARANGAMIFCRTFENYFGQFVWIEKKRVTIIVAFHFMKRRLKTLTKTHDYSRLLRIARTKNGCQINNNQLHSINHSFQCKCFDSRDNVQTVRRRFFSDEYVCQPSSH